MKAHSPDHDMPSILELTWMMPAGPDRELLFRYAGEFQQELGKQRLREHLQRLDATSRAMVAGLEARKDDATVRVAVGTREGLRAIALSEKIIQRLREIDLESFKLARARIYAETGRRVCHADQPRPQPQAAPSANPVPAFPAPAPAAKEALHPDLQAAMSFVPDPNATPQELQAMISALVYETDEEMDAASDLEVAIRAHKLMAVRQAMKDRGIDPAKELLESFELAGVGGMTQR